MDLSKISIKLFNIFIYIFILLGFVITFIIFSLGSISVDAAYCDDCDLNNSVLLIKDQVDSNIQAKFIVDLLLKYNNYTGIIALLSWIYVLGVQPFIYERKINKLKKVIKNEK